MEFIKPGININFVGFRRKAFVISLALILAGAVTIVLRGGLNLGIDFAGGTMIQVKFQEPVEPDRLRDALRPLGMGKAVVQEFGDTKGEYLIKAEASHKGLSDFSLKVRKSLEASFGQNSVEVRRVEMVGPQVGADLREKALLAIFYSLLLIAIYISGRFELKWLKSGAIAGGLGGTVYLLEGFGVSMTAVIFTALAITLALCWFLDLPYALAALVALVHDVAITTGAFAMSDKEFSLPIVAALLTIVGYSLNDTIIVFDRIRENLAKYRLRKPLSEVVNLSINETLSRTVLTSATTLVVVLTLFIMGGGVIHDFSFALLVGVAVGTYSSVYVASPILLLWEERFRAKKKGPA